MFWRLRVLVFYLIISIIALLFSVLCIVAMLLGASYAWRYRIAAQFSSLFVHLMWLICGIKYQVHNQHLIPKHGAYLVLANHQSFWENFFMQIVIPPHSWVLKQELFNMPILNIGLKMLRPIAVDRGDKFSVQYIIKAGQEKLAAGLSLIIFPEATRIKVGQNVRFKASAAKLALESKSPILLMAHNAGKFWPKGFWFKQPGVIEVVIIEYLSATEVSSFENFRLLNQYIEDKITQQKNLL